MLDPSGLFLPVLLGPTIILAYALSVASAIWLSCVAGFLLGTGAYLVTDVGKCMVDECGVKISFERPPVAGTFNNLGSKATKCFSETDVCVALFSGALGCAMGVFGAPLAALIGGSVSALSGPIGRFIAKQAMKKVFGVIGANATC